MTEKDFPDLRQNVEKTKEENTNEKKKLNGESTVLPILG